MSGTLYLVPTPLGGEALLPASVVERVHALEYFVAEQPKSARAFLKQIGYPRPLASVRVEALDADTPAEILRQLLAPIESGADAGLVSEAGAPAVADPGARLVRLAHARGVTVVPLVGPSALLLALMASGLDGQRFAFHGYLPVDENELARRLRELEDESRKKRQTQLFIETPYRNDRLLRVLLARCAPSTLLCVATDLTLAGESVTTRPIAEWRKTSTTIGKRPTVFLLLAS